MNPAAPRRSGRGRGEQYRSAGCAASVRCHAQADLSPKTGSKDRVNKVARRGVKRNARAVPARQAAARCVKRWRIWCATGDMNGWWLGGGLRRRPIWKGAQQALRDAVSRCLRAGMHAGTGRRA